MNLGLLDPFQADFPEVIEEYLEHGITKCIAFNRRGTLLAAGCTDGACVIWDFDTRGVAKELRDPDSTTPVTSVCWSKCGYRLLSATTDKLLILWDVSKGVKLYSFSLQQAALHCRLDPGTALPTLCLACPLSGAPVLVDFIGNVAHTLPVTGTAGNGEGGPGGRGKHVDASPAYTPSTASFNKKGDLIYVGNFKGEIVIIDTKLRKVRSVFSVPGGAAIRHIVFSRNDQYLLTNSNDRNIRVFENLLPRNTASITLAQTEESLANGNKGEIAKPHGHHCLQLLREFHDAVNKMHWKVACFNGDGECVVGGSANKGEHKIHIWNRNFGQLARILEGPKEGLSDLAWHPTRPVVASVSMSGAIYLWAKDYTENWSAFAPDFKELEENEEYVEKEDEFDIVFDVNKVQAPSLEDDVEVDIMTIEKIAAFSDSDESEGGLYFLPTAPVPDELLETSSRDQPATPLKPSSSSATESDRSPASEQDPNSRQMEHSLREFARDSPAEEEVAVNGRLKRKRKLSEKAAELQAEKGRRTAHKVRTPIPKSKTLAMANSDQGPSVAKRPGEKVWIGVTTSVIKDSPRTMSLSKQIQDDGWESAEDEV